MKRRVVITGLGVVCPLGHNKEEIVEAIKSSLCALGPISHYDASEDDVSLAGEIKDFKDKDLLEPKAARRMDLVNQYGLVAGIKAYKDSGLTSSGPRHGISVGSGIGGINTIQEDSFKACKSGFSRISPFFIPKVISNMIAAYLAIELKFNGSCKCPVTACASGTDAIGEAFHSIRHGYLDVVLCGGAEAGINPLAIGGFSSMKALSTSKDPKRASIPFDKERDGFVMGEGAGILVLEELGHALERGAKIYAEIIGYGSTCDAGHITQPSPGGELAFRAMEMALEDGGLSADKLDYINAHGTSTSLNDKTETQAIQKLLGEHVKDVFVSSSKSMMGHLLGASGAVEAIITLVAMEEGVLPPNVGYRVADKECDLNFVLEPRAYEFKTALSNSFGFGGHNASILFRKWEEDEV